MWHILLFHAVCCFYGTCWNSCPSSCYLLHIISHSHILLCHSYSRHTFTIAGRYSWSTSCSHCLDHAEDGLRRLDVGKCIRDRYKASSSSTSSLTILSTLAAGLPRVLANMEFCATCLRLLAFRWLFLGWNSSCGRWRQRRGSFW